MATFRNNFVMDYLDALFRGDNAQQDLQGVKETLQTDDLVKTENNVDIDLSCQLITCLDPFKLMALQNSSEEQSTSSTYWLSIHLLLHLIKLLPGGYLKFYSLRQVETLLEQARRST